MTEQLAEPTVQCRSYTRARRYQIVIGSIGSNKLPFGPYTYTQSAILVVGFVAVLLTRGIWGQVIGGWLGLIVMSSIPIGAAYAIRNTRPEDRSPVLFLLGWIKVRTGPRHGFVNGRAVRHRSDAFTVGCIPEGD